MEEYRFSSQYSRVVMLYLAADSCFYLTIMLRLLLLLCLLLLLLQLVYQLGHQQDDASPLASNIELDGAVQFKRPSNYIYMGSVVFRQPGDFACIKVQVG
jgi:hypothetical protein